MPNDGARGRKVRGFYLNRVGRIMLACILVAVAIWPVGIQPQATQAAPVYVYAPPTPTLSYSSPVQVSEDWREYSNPVFGYSLRYPLSMFYREWNPAADLLHSVSFYMAQDSEQPLYQVPEIAVSIFDNPQKQTSKEWFLAHSDQLGTQAAKASAAFFQGATQPMTVTVDGLEALTFGETFRGIHAERVVLARDEIVFSISYTDFGDGKLGPIYWAVVSTLRWSTHEPETLSPPKPTDNKDLTATSLSGIDQQAGVIPASPGYRLPWTGGVTYRVAQGWSGSTHTCPGQMCYAYDFDDGGTSFEGVTIRASDGGSVAFIKNDVSPNTCGGYDYRNLVNYVTIYHSDGTATLYLHLRQVNVGYGSIGQGTVVGLAGKTGWTGCYPHLHFQRQSQGVWIANSTPIYFDEYPGVQLQYDDWYRSQNSGGGGDCPQSGGVILYWHKDYNCDNGEGDPGYRQRTSTGFENISGAFNDDASSLRVPSGWSVRLYEHADRGGASTCRNVDDNNFEGQNFDGSSVGLNDKVSSFEVFDNSTNCNPGSPPQQVELWSLANWDGDIVFSEGTGFSNEPNADSYSMKIPRGWSVKTWRGDNRGGGEPRCWSESVRNLQDHGWHLAIQSIEVFDSDACPMRLNFTTGLGHSAEVEIVVTSVGDHDDQLSQNNVTTDSQGNGSVELSGCVVSGKHYDIYAKPRGYLRQKRSVLLQPGTNSVAFDSPFKKGDIIDDNSVSVMDLLYVLENWGSSDPAADLNGDGTVLVGDLLIVLNNWGTGDGWTDSRTLKCGTAAMGTQDAIRAQEANGSITLTPDAGTFNVGDTFDMQVLLDTGGHETDGVDLIVLYDPGVLAVQDTDPITGTQISAGSIYTNTRANTVVPSLGAIRYSADVGEDGSAFQGSGTLATITFTVTAAISNTAVTVYYQDGWTGESNIIESETITDVLGYANIASFQTIGSPSRPMPSISFTPVSNAFVNTSLVELEAEATDPYNQVKEVEFEVNLNGVWTKIGSDTFDPYWKYRWDASSVPDGVYDLRASALLLGGEGTTVTNSNIMLDRTLPTYISSTITLLGEPYVGVPVAIEVTADDEGSGVDHIDAYARKVYDSAVYGAWKFIGSIPGSQGSLVWNTSGYWAGTSQIAFSIQDKAGNWGPDSQPELLLGLKGKVFLPVILKNSDGTAPPVETLNFKVSFQGRDNAAGQLQNVPIKVKIKNPSGDQTLFESGWISVTPAGSSNNWGTASVDVSSAALTPGQTYQVLVKGAMHLAKRITTSLTNGQTIDYTDPALNPDGFLRAGDIDQDNQVGTADVDILLSHWGGTPPANPDPSSILYRSDLDGDGDIATSDYLILLDSWGTGDPY